MRLALVFAATVALLATSAAPARRAAGCPFADGSVITYNPNGYGQLFSALRAHQTPCLQYYVTIAPKSDKRSVRVYRGDGKQKISAFIRSAGSNFHAVAEFNWGGWQARKDLSWFKKGQAFRKQMDAAGYELWAVNEFPNATRSLARSRKAAEDLVRGLYSGPARKSRKIQGIVFQPGFGQEKTAAELSPYKAATKTLLTDAAFWNAMNAYVGFWSQETYASCFASCPNGAIPQTRTRYLNAYLEHPVRLAYAGGAQTALAKAYLQRHYFSTLTASWQSPAYGRTTVPLAAMQGLVSLETYAVRRWATGNAYPGGRIGFSWNDQSSAAPAKKQAFQAVADRVATALHDAYSPGSKPTNACGAGLAWCKQWVRHAHFNSAWFTFDTW